MALIRRRADGAMGVPAGPAKITTWMQAHRFLTEYLTHTTFDDGSPRQTSTITIMKGDVEGVKVVLNDKEEDSCLWATGDDPEDALCTLDALLNTPNPPWRPNNFSKSVKKAAKPPLDGKVPRV